MTRHDTRRSTTEGTEHEHAVRAVTLVAVLVVGTLGGVAGVATVAAQGPTVSAGDASVGVGETTTIPVVLDEAPDGVAGFNVSVTVADGSTATVVDASVSDQFGLTDPTVDDGRATLTAVDLNGNVEAGATDIRLGTITVRGETRGTTDLAVTIGSLDADGGTAIDADTDSGTLTVGDRDGETSTPTPTPTSDGPTVSAGDASVATGETTTVPVVLSEAPDGLAGFNVTVGVADEETATVVDASVSDQFGLGDPSAGDGEATLVASDTNGNVEPGATDVRLGTVTVRGDADGTTDLSVTVNQLDADGGARIDAGTDPGTLSVGGENGDDDSGDGTGMPPGVERFTATSPLSADQTDPASLAGKLRVESQYAQLVSAELIRNSSTNFTLAITGPDGVTNVSFYLQETAFAASQDLSNVNATLDGEPLPLGSTEARGSTWLGFEIDRFSTRTVTFETDSTDDTGTPSDGPTVSASDASVATGETTTIPVVLDEAPDGLAGFNVSVSVGDPGTATVVDASVSDQFGLSNPTADSARATLVASDTNGNVEAGATDVRLGTVTVRGETDGSTDLSVTITQLDADGGARIDAGTDSGTLTVGEPTDGTGTTLRLVPSEGTAPLGGTTTYELVVGEVTGGVGSYAIDVSVADPTTATIAAASNEIGGTGEVDIGSDNASVRVGAFAGDTVDSGTNVTIATVTVRGQRLGSTTLAVEPTSVSDEGGTQYDLGRAVGATVAVREIERPEPVGESESRPIDPDGDGVYEDLNGDGEVLPGDATVLFEAVFSGEIPSDDTRFDMNGDGRTLPGDATVLFNEAFAS